MNQPVIEFSNFSFTYHNADSESLTGIDLSFVRVNLSF